MSGKKILEVLSWNFVSMSQWKVECSDENSSPVRFKNQVTRIQHEQTNNLLE
jgi:hypothetical protein